MPCHPLKRTATGVDTGKGILLRQPGSMAVSHHCLRGCAVTLAALILAGPPTACGASPSTPAEADVLERLVHDATARQLADISRAPQSLYLAAQSQSAAETLLILRSQIELYRIQHLDQPPASLEQLLKKTSSAGTVADKGPCGPYLDRMPANPFNHSTMTATPEAAGAETGWSYDPASGTVKLILPPELATLAANFPPDALQTVKAGSQAALPDTVTVDRKTLEKTIHAEVQRQLFMLLQQQRVAQLQTHVLQMRSALQTMRCQLELYQLQHANKLPKQLDALLQRTDATGAPTDQGPFGPYLSKMPVNPLNGSSIVAMNQTTTLKNGWTYDPATGTLKALLPPLLAPLAEEMPEDVEVVTDQDPQR